LEIICVITEWAAAFTENIIALSAVALAAGKKKGHNKYILYLSALSFVATIIIRIMNQIESFSYITAVLAILISVLGAKFLSSGSVWIRLSAAILTFTVIYSVDYIVVALMGFFSGASENFFSVFVTTPGISFLVIDKACDVLLYFGLRKRLSGFHTLTKHLQYPLLVLSIISFTAMQVLFQVVVAKSFPAMQLAVIFSWAFVVGFVAAVTAFFISLAKNEQSKKSAEILQMENALMEENYRQINAQQEAYARELHDFKHHLMVIREYVQTHKEPELNTYIDSLLKTSYAGMLQCHSGNDIIDAVINCKSAEAKALDIQFSFITGLYTPIQIDPIDICGVLANQLDNAFDACKLISDPKDRNVRVEIKQIEDMVFFIVKNTVENNPFETDPQLHSTKKSDGKRHGYGLTNICAIAEKYNGCMQTEYSSGSFISSVSLCCKPLDT
jgi:sensor histidine kinase YesM